MRGSLRLAHSSPSSSPASHQASLARHQAPTLPKPLPSLLSPSMGLLVAARALPCSPLAAGSRPAGRCRLGAGGGPPAPPPAPVAAAAAARDSNGSGRLNAPTPLPPASSAARRQRLCVVRAQEGGSAPPPPEQQQQQQDDERRLEALEAAARARKGVKAEQADAFRGSPAARRAAQAAAGNMPEWKEGQLFPEGGWAAAAGASSAARAVLSRRWFAEPLPAPLPALTWPSCCCCCCRLQGGSR